MRILNLGGLLVAMMVSTLSMAQNNMVPNGSFEETEKKVKNGEGDIMLATPWVSPDLENQADLYLVGNKKGYGIPENDRGYMDVDHGSSYAGFRAFSYREKLPRTYLQVKLKKPLIAGKKYCVNFDIVLAKTSKYASSNIGMYISEKKPKSKDIDTYTIRPQITNSNKIYEDRHVWEQVCGVYTASGNERYITIGNFVSNDDMTVKQDYLKIRKLKEFPQLQMEEAYYIVDNVTFINLEELDFCKCAADDDGGNEMKVVYSMSTSDGMDLDASQQVELKQVHFGKNSTTPNSGSTVREVITLLKENASLNVEVIGHMDKVEQKDNLKDLSAERAQAIYDYLIKNGIEESRLSYKGVKSTDPLDASGTQTSLAKNRRVTFKVK